MTELKTKLLCLWILVCIDCIYKRLTLMFFIFLALGFFTVYNNPFGISKKVELLSQDTVAKIVAPLFPFGKSNQKDKIVVVLINGESLELTSRLPETQRMVYANEWPIRYQDHANILKTIAANSNPRQVFIDIEFHQIRNTDSTFPSLIRTIKLLREKKGIEFLHAGGGFESQISEEVNNLLSPYSTKVTNAWESSYMPLWFGSEAQMTLSPALQMYKNLKGGEINTSLFKKEMFVFWRQQLNSEMFPGLEEPQCYRSSSLIVEIWNEFLNSYFSVLSDSDKCFPQKTIYLDELQQLVNQGAEGKKKIRKIFDGATVIYGASYVALGDRYSSPTHGTIPGAFYHAMALENLLEFDSDYFKVYSEWLDIIIWVLLTILILTISYFKKKTSGEGSVRWFWVFVTYFAYFSMLVALGYVLRIAPANFIALFGLIFFAWWLLSKELQLRIALKSWCKDKDLK